ncbi:hypothetical protein F5877DRAFT_80306 [Lentinula edodes]|nr:hypothetical protein F5877DRAFT_80306 [Lentinula edodes]
MNRPRPSVLAQFDPLLSETQPDYVSDSEDESDPDKENSVPELNELSMTAFFSHTYKREYAQPAALTKRLVDIGDVTIADTVDEEEETEESGDNGENAFFSLDTPKRSDTVRLPQNTSRSPLAEISLERKPRQNVVHKKAMESPTQLPGDSISALTSLVDSVNLAGKTFGHIHRHILPPRITVDNSDAENDIPATAAPFNLQTSTSSLQDASEAATVSLLAPPSPATTPVSRASNRISLDLHSSFNLQLQSETSFDLLNDRISFFDAQGKGMSSFLNELDDDSDPERFDADTSNTSQSTECNNEDTTITQNTNVTQNAQPEQRGSSTSPSTLSSPFESSTSPLPSPLVFGPLLNQANSMITPAVQRTVAPTVPALRVIKRTKRYDDERTSSSTSSTSLVSGTVNNAPGGKMPSPPLMTAPLEAQGPPPSKTASRHEGLTRAIIAESSASTTAKAMLKPSLSKASSVSGPRRVLLPESGKPTKPASGPGTFARPKIPVPTLATVHGRASAVASGISRPAVVSGIPPPVSKLPAPSGIARFGRKASAPPSSESSSRMAPVRLIPRRYPTYGP